MKTTTFKTLLSKQPARKHGGAELALAFLVVAVIAMMIVPLPTVLVDVLIATNLSVTVVILLVVLFAPDALAIAAFPTILLLTTLFRLALNISSTRLILLQGDAGSVIRAFGSFVVRGNYVVGGIVFLVLTIIQFMVVAKGSERIAEIGCRFTLDAMPGKQMAIDAEVRSGAIDGAEARRRRRALSRESQFFGAMDGAMKYVKNDVLAAMLIAAVNIGGGLVIGVMQRHLSAGDALKRYALLTIGDGLVSQIPSLVLSTAAGLLVTRTASETEGTPLGEELARQVLGTPKALQVAAVFLVLLALVPGLPMLPFVALAIGLVLIARARTARLANEHVSHEASSQPTTAGKGLAFVPHVLPWSLDLAEDLEHALDDVGAVRGLRSRIVEVRERVFAELGVPLPPPRVRVDASVPSGHVVLSVNEVPEKVIALRDEQDVPALVADVAYTLLRGRAAEFVGLHETQRLLDELAQFAPAVVSTTTQKVTLPVLTEVLRRLVEEDIPIRDLRLILETLGPAVKFSSDPATLADLVRGKMRRTITYALTRGAKVLHVVTLDHALERLILANTTFSPEGQVGSLTIEQVQALHDGVRRAFAECTEHPAWSPQRPIVLVRQPKIRRQVRTYLAAEWPTVFVTTFLEMVSDVALRPLATAKVDHTRQEVAA